MRTLTMHENKIENILVTLVTSKLQTSLFAAEKN
jgi:hypothetical protein